MTLDSRVQKINFGYIHRFYTRLKIKIIVTSSIKPSILHTPTRNYSNGVKTERFTRDKN